jgi:hypothetical protein
MDLPKPLGENQYVGYMNGTTSLGQERLLESRNEDSNLNKLKSMIETTAYNSCLRLGDKL